MKEYETIFVLRPDGAESQANELLEKISGTISKHGGTILQQKDWGKRELAYQVKKYNQGHYFYFNYSGGLGLVADIERTLKLNDLQLKFLTVKLDENVDIDARKKEIASIKEVKPLPEKVQNAADDDGDELVAGSDSDDGIEEVQNA